MGSCFTALLSLGLTCGIGGFVLALLVAIPKGGSDAVVTAMNACPAVVDALGTPIELTPLSLGCGKEASGGGSGLANFTLSVAGPKASGTVAYRASYTAGGPWEINAATVSLADGRAIAAVPCQGGATGGPVAPPKGPGPPRPDRGEDRGKGGKRR
jgi:hypothetical protein